MRTLTTVSIALVAFTACLSAQNTIVSPIGATSTEGSGSNAFPFTSSVIRRYQQIHSDLGSGAKLIKQLSFRANGGSTNYTGTRAMDIELALCDAGDYASISNNFSANYIGSPTTVISRTIVNLGPQGQASIPSPFQGMDLSFSPYVHSGTNSLLWEMKVYGNVLSGTFGSPDADASTTTSGSTSVSGTGCVATGRTSAMTITATSADMGGYVGIGLGVSNAPSNQLYWISLGTSNPALSVPGWCGTFYTNNITLFPAGLTNASGSALYYENFSVHLQNTFGGPTFTLQALALDPGLTNPVQVAMSNGASMTLPLPNTTKVVQVSRMFDSSGTTTATSGLRFTTSTVGYGLVTRFTY